MTDEQIKKLIQYVIEAVKSKGATVKTYRGLIYEVLNVQDYIGGMDLGLLDLNNVLVSLGNTQ